MNHNEFMNMPTNPKMGYPPPNIPMNSNIQMGYMNQDIMMPSQMNHIPPYMNTQQHDYTSQPHLVGRSNIGRDNIDSNIHLNDPSIQPQINFLSRSSNSNSLPTNPQIPYDDNEMMYDMMHSKMNVKDIHSMDPNYHGNIPHHQSSYLYKSSVDQQQQQQPDFQIQNERDFPSLTKDKYHLQQHNSNSSSGRSSSSSNSGNIHHPVHGESSGNQQQTRYPQNINQQQHQHQQQTSSSIHPKLLAMNDTYDLSYLININRLGDKSLNILYNGIDLSSLDMDLTSTNELYPKFISPYTRLEDDYKLPSCYEIPNLTPLSSKIHMKKFYEEVLFYIFYSMPRDVLQMLAASELYDRNWRYHKIERRWLKNYQEPITKTQTYEIGSYWFFDAESWEKKIIDNFRLDYEHIDIV